MLARWRIEYSFFQLHARLHLRRACVNLFATMHCLQSPMIMELPFSLEKFFSDYRVLYCHVAKAQSEAQSTDNPRDRARRLSRTLNPDPYPCARGTKRSEAFPPLVPPSLPPVLSPGWLPGAPRPRAPPPARCFFAFFSACFSLVPSLPPCLSVNCLWRGSEGVVLLRSCLLPLLLFPASS